MPPLLAGKAIEGGRGSEFGLLFAFTEEETLGDHVF